MSTVLERRNPELSIDTRFFKFRPFYDPVEPFEVDPFPYFEKRREYGESKVYGIFEISKHAPPVVNSKNKFDCIFKSHQLR